MTKNIEMKVGSFYFSKAAGVLECIAERDGEFYCGNTEYGYHVDSNGKVIQSYYATDEENFNLQYNCTKEGTPLLDETTKHNHYFKDVSKLVKIDVYAVLALYEVTDPCIQHAVKKLLCTGKRGHKDFLKDIQDSIDSLVRCIELNEELSK